MWLSRRSFILSTFALAGCGFTPAYGPAGGAQKLQDLVGVEAPTDRSSYLLTQRLEERLGRASAPRYGLSYGLDISEERMAITATNVTTRFNMVGRATYALRDLTSGAVLTSGTVDSFTGYSANSSTVATLSAGRDARNRLMVILADNIVTRLVAFAPELPA